LPSEADMQFSKKRRQKPSDRKRSGSREVTSIGTTRAPNPASRKRFQVERQTLHLALIRKVGVAQQSRPDPASAILSDTFSWQHDTSGVGRKVHLVAVTPFRRRRETLAAILTRTPPREGSPS